MCLQVAEESRVAADDDPGPFAKDRAQERVDRRIDLVLAALDREGAPRGPALRRVIAADPQVCLLHGQAAQQGRAALLYKEYLAILR